MAPSPPTILDVRRPSVATMTTYYSFPDADEFAGGEAAAGRTVSREEQMARRDSGYESAQTKPSSSTRRRTSSTSTRKLIRPSSRKHNKPSSFTVPTMPPSTRPRTCTVQSSGAACPPAGSGTAIASGSEASSVPSSGRPSHDDYDFLSSARRHDVVPRCDAAAMPPQTTCYWTSNHTRRLEYEAIDAASRGLKGWMKRNLVPECFAPGAKRADRHVAFDDDRGSVRRYRLDLDEYEEEDDDEDEGGERRDGKMWKKFGRKTASC